MSAWHCLALIRPIDPQTGERVTVRVASAQLRAITGLGGNKWMPAMVQPPKLTMQFFDGDFSSPIAVAAGDMVLSLSALAATKEHPHVRRYFWAGAEVTIWLGKAGQIWPWKRFLQAEVSSAVPRGDKLTLSAAVNGDGFEKDVLTAKYLGTGGKEGPESLKGQVKPLALGWPQNVEPVPIDLVNNVYQFSGYGPIEAVTSLYERGSAYGAAVGNYSTYANLVAATIAPGGWATCLAEGMIRLGAPAYGVITADLKGHAVDGTAPRLAGELIRLAADLSGVPEGLLCDESLSRMDRDKPWQLADVLDQQVSFFDLARSIALDCGHQGGISAGGQFFVARPALDRTEAFTLHAQGKRMPQVADANEENVRRPYWRVVLGAERSFRVHSSEEIAWGGYVPRGIYDAATVYRKDDLVSASDGRMFAYVNATPSAGNAPPAAPATSNAWWELFGAADSTSGNQVYLDPVDKVQVAANSTNDPSQSLAGTARRVILRQGGVDISASSGVTFAVGTLPGGITAAFGSGANKNLLSFTAIEANGSVPVTATFGGKVYYGTVEVIVGLAGNGNVGNGNVGTPAIVDEAVTTKAYAYTAGSTLIVNGGYSYQQIQSATIVTTGEDVEVEGGFEVDVIDNCKYTYRLRRNGSTLIDIGPITVSTADSPYAFVKFVDSPAAGSHTYTLDVACNDAANINALNRAIFAKEIKR